MPRNYYSVDYDNANQVITAWGSKGVRDAFVEHGNRRFAKTRREADSMCLHLYECNATEAFKRLFI